MLNYTSVRCQTGSVGVSRRTSIVPCASASSGSHFNISTWSAPDNNAKHMEHEQLKPWEESLLEACEKQHAEASTSQAPIATRRPNSEPVAQPEPKEQETVYLDDVSSLTRFKIHAPPSVVGPKAKTKTKVTTSARGSKRSLATRSDQRLDAFVQVGNKKQKTSCTDVVPSSTLATESVMPLLSVDESPKPDFRILGNSTVANAVPPARFLRIPHPTEVTIAQTLKFERQQLRVLDSIFKGCGTFFTGSAGTGKSTLLREIISSLVAAHRSEPLAVAITATTGIAASIIQGKTLHAWLGIGVASKTLEQHCEQSLKIPTVRLSVRCAKVLIIDEGSSDASLPVPYILTGCSGHGRRRTAEHCRGCLQAAPRTAGCVWRPSGGILWRLFPGEVWLLTPASANACNC